MAEWNEREEVTYRKAIDDKLDLILEQTTRTNGRLWTAEMRIAVLSWGYGLAAVVGAAAFAWILSSLRPR
jgi:hypothetical protein